jgi:hypothetical protein
LPRIHADERGSDFFCSDADCGSGRDFWGLNTEDTADAEEKLGHGSTRMNADLIFSVLIGEDLVAIGGALLLVSLGACSVTSVVELTMADAIMKVWP